jgi:HPt (histidine-containing phosphotransfer) domain-containing protein
VFESFLRDAPAYLAALRAACAAGDVQAAGKAAHALRGAASNTGARALSGAAGAVEAAASQGGALVPLLAALEEVFDQSVRAISAERERLRRAP